MGVQRSNRKNADLKSKRKKETNLKKTDTHLDSLTKNHLSTDSHSHSTTMPEAAIKCWHSPPPVQSTRIQSARTRTRCFQRQEWNFQDGLAANERQQPRGHRPPARHNAHEVLGPAGEGAWQGSQSLTSSHL